MLDIMLHFKLSISRAELVIQYLSLITSTDVSIFGGTTILSVNHTWNLSVISDSSHCPSDDILQSNFLPSFLSLHL